MRLLFQAKNSEKLNMLSYCLSRVYSWLYLYFVHMCIFYTNSTQHLFEAALILKYLHQYCS